MSGSNLFRSLDALMLVTLPCIEYRSYKRSSRRKLEFGWVLTRLSVSISEVDTLDAPVALRFTDPHGQTWGVRHYGPHFYVPAGYDGLAESIRISPNDLETGNPQKARGLAMLLRALMGSTGSNLRYQDCFNLFEIWHDVPVEDGELGGNKLVDQDKVPALQISGPASTFETRVKAAYESAIIVDDEVYRRCDEPRFVLNFEDEYDPDHLIVWCNVEVEPQLHGTLSGVRGEAYPHEAWERPALRIDRHGDLEDLIRVYTRRHSDVRVVSMVAPEVIIDPLLIYDDEADMLQRTAAGVVSEGHGELMWVETETIYRWAHLKDAISIAHETPSDTNLEALNTALKAYGQTLDDEARADIVQSATERFDMRPVKRRG